MLDLTKLGFVDEYLEQHQFLMQMKCPAQSLDPSLIEPLWDYLSRWMAALSFPLGSLNELPIPVSDNLIVCTENQCCQANSL